MKYILISLAYFAIIFVFKVLFPMIRFRGKYSMAVNLYRMSQEVVETAAQYGEHVLIGEVELEYKRFHAVCYGMNEVYIELEKNVMKL